MLGTGTLWSAGIGALASLVLVGPAGASAGAYRFVDEAGTVHYTNAPDSPRYRSVPGFPAARPNVLLVTRSSGLRSVSVRARATRPYAALIREAAERHRVDVGLVEAVVTAESAGNPRAVSRKGAQGLMQLMPQRSVQLGVRDPFDPRQNIEGGVRHLRDLLARYNGNLTLTLAAYNAGVDAVRTYSGVPPYAETQEYVRRVRALYDGLEGPGPAWAVGQTPQQIYQQVGDDGTVTFTNVPPRPKSTLKRGF
jgi:soluble lytic murein transglycosylase-like protein